MSQRVRVTIAVLKPAANVLRGKVLNAENAKAGSASFYGSRLVLAYVINEYTFGVAPPVLLKFLKRYFKPGFDRRKSQILYRPTNGRSGGKRTMSVSARRRISLAQKARWAAWSKKKVKAART